MREEITAKQNSWQVLYANDCVGQQVFYNYREAERVAKSHKNVLGLLQTKCVFRASGVSANKGQTELIFGQDYKVDQYTFQIIRSRGRLSQKVFYKFLDALTEANNSDEVEGLLVCRYCITSEGETSLKSRNYLLRGDLFEAKRLPDVMSKLIGHPVYVLSSDEEKYIVTSSGAIAPCAGGAKLLRPHYIPDSRK